MSACSYIFQDNCAHLITDAATYEYDGTIIEIRSKVVHLHAIGAAYAIRGALGSYTHTIRETLERATSLDELRRSIGPACETIHALAQLFASKDVLPDHAHFELSIIGYSEEMGGVGGWTIATHPEPKATDLPEYAPYELQEMPAMFVRPGINSITAALGLAKPIKTLDQLCAVNPVQAAVSILEAQRAQVFSEGGLDSVRCVGGFGELTTVTATGVATIEVIRWDDRVGEKIAAVPACG